MQDLEACLRNWGERKGPEKVSRTSRSGDHEADTTGVISLCIEKGRNSVLRPNSNP